MRQTNRLALLAGTAVVIGAGSTALAAQEQSWSGSNADEVRAIVAEMMADAETRSSMLQSGGVAGYDGSKFFLASGDGNFRLNVGGQIQFRYYVNFRSDDDGVVGFDPDTGDPILAQQSEFETGFQTRRTKLFFNGHVYDPNLFYSVSGNFSSDGGGFDLEDAFVGYRWDNGFSFRWGQFKLPYMREELVQSQHQLAVDRSIVNEVFNQGRSQGVELAYEQESWRAALAFSDGFNSANSEFATGPVLNANGYPAGGEADYAFTARVEFLFSGAWAQFKDFTSPAGSDFGLLLGVAGHIEGGDDLGAPGTGFRGDSYTYAGVTADLSLEGDGWNAYVAFVYSHIDPKDTSELNDYGIVLQGGFMLPNTDWELFGRYDVYFPDDDRASDDTFNTITIGANYYMHGHAAKFTADLMWFIDDVSRATLFGSNPGIGFLGDTDDNELVFRLQFQLLF